MNWNFGKKRLDELLLQKNVIFDRLWEYETLEPQINNLWAFVLL